MQKSPSCVRASQYEQHMLDSCRIPSLRTTSSLSLPEMHDAVKTTQTRAIQMANNSRASDILVVKIIIVTVIISFWSNHFCC